MKKTFRKSIKKVIRKIEGSEKTKINENKIEQKKVNKPYIEIGENWDNQENPIAFMFGFDSWKRERISKFFPEYRTAFMFGKANFSRLIPFLRDLTDVVFVVWSYSESTEVSKYAKEHNIKLIRVDDGFIRSIGLAGKRALPVSIVADKRSLYLNANEPSELEEILHTYDFETDGELLQRAKHCIDLVVKNKISKYNYVESKDINKIYGKKTKKRVLVIGEVEDDASIKYGVNRNVTNNELVFAAYRENPDAEIIFKPHPDILEGYREEKSESKDVSLIAKVIKEPLSMPGALEQ